MRNNSKAHTGFVGSTGVQAHSAGEHFPVLSYCIGSADHRVAEFQGVRRECTNAAVHANDLRRLKRAEVIADSVYADRAGGSAFFERDGWSGSPARGYCVGLAGFETRINGLDGAYGAVYADIVGKIESVERDFQSGRPVCIGWWTRDGVTYLDVSVVIFDRDEALAFAERNDQIAIYDIAAGSDIDIRYA